MSAGAIGWGRGHRSNPHSDLYLSQIPRERIIQRTGPEQGVQFTPALHSEAKHFLLLHSLFQRPLANQLALRGRVMKMKLVGGNSFCCYNVA